MSKPQSFPLVSRPVVSPLLSRVNVPLRSTLQEPSEVSTWPVRVVALEGRGALPYWISLSANPQSSPPLAVASATPWRSTMQEPSEVSRSPVMVVEPLLFTVRRREPLKVTSRETQPLNV